MAFDTIVDIIAESCKSSKEEAAECLLKSIFSKYENSFISVAIDKCLIKKIEAEEKMDVVSTEAMIQDANISIPFWFKRPDLYLQSQFNDMIDHSLLKDLIRVDVIIGGDHGGSKFRMMMKVNFRLPGKKTVSYLTQIARVSYSKDNTEILRDTVLDLIGEGLRLIDAGGSFVVLYNESTLEFTLSNTADQSVHCSCPLEAYLVGDLKFYAQMSGREDMSSYWCMWCMLHPSE